MVYNLGVLATKHVERTNQVVRQKHIQLMLDLTESEYSSYVASTKSLFSVRSDAHLFTIVRWNHQAYFSTLDRYLEAHMSGNTEFLNQRPVYLEINRQALNFLSSVRTYIDHHGTSISRRHGTASQNLKRYEQYCSDAYDSSFAYRFLYKLRDYSQHCGLPINSIHLSDSLSPGNIAERVHSLEVGIHRDRILQDFNWKALKAEVAAQPPTIDVNSHISRLMSDLDGINQSVIQDELPALQQSAREIIALVSRIEYDEGMPCVFELDDSLLTQSIRKRRKSANLRFTVVPVSLADSVLQSGYEALSGADLEQSQ